MQCLRPILAVSFLLALSGMHAHAEPTDGVTFDGKSGYRVEADAFKINPHDFSVAAWVRVSSVPEPQMFMTLGAPANDMSLYLYQGKVRMLVEHAPKGKPGIGGKYDFALAPAPEADRWTHYLGTYDGRTIAIYKDGVLQGKKEAACERTAFADTLYLGTSPEKGRTLRGALDEVRIWNRALTSEEAMRVFDGKAVAEAQIARWTAAGKTKEAWNNAIADAPVAKPYNPARAQQVALLNRKDDGYRGIWYHNQPSDDEYVYKYSGGLGVYPANHLPFAVYAPEVDKTFFCYGGTEKGTERSLLHEVSYFDHKTGTVPRPTILLDKKTDDAHDNPVMSIDEAGHLWIFSTSHGTGRPSFIHRSKKPYDIEEFERVEATKMQDGKTVPIDNFSYLQVYHWANKGFFAAFTTYDKRVLNDPQTIAQRILCSMSSRDGVTWSDWKPFAGILFGHYQSTGMYKNEKIGTSFNFHPNDRESGRIGLNYRSNLYYLETGDFGETWQTVTGVKPALPLREMKNEAIVYDYYTEGLNVYIMDVNFDAAGRPIILYLTSKGYESGPKNDPRRWHTAYWTGGDWKIRPITDSDNNYDFGSLYVEEDGLWRIIGTTESGPQAYNTGGEVAMWTSGDTGDTWIKAGQLTAGSEFNHCYPRRPLNAHPDFYAIWADGHGRRKSESTLYFCNKKGEVFLLPRDMKEETQKPQRLRQE